MPWWGLGICVFCPTDVGLFQPNSALEPQQLSELSQKEIPSPEQAFRITEWFGLEVISKVI